MLKSQGQETPLDHIPDQYRWHNWFLGAYNILTNSRTESGMIPLSELKVYSDNFGLIGSFSEFVDIIYSMNNINNEHIVKERNKK